MYETIKTADIINNYLCYKLPAYKDINEDINEMYKKIDLLKKKQLKESVKNVETIMKIKIKINHLNLELEQVIRDTTDNVSFVDIVKKNTIKFRVLIHIFKDDIKHFLINKKTRNYIEQIILDTVNSVINNQLDKSPRVADFIFMQILQTLCKILSKIKYKTDNLQQEIQKIENIIKKTPNFVGGSKSSSIIKYKIKYIY